MRLKTDREKFEDLLLDFGIGSELAPSYTKRNSIDINIDCAKTSGSQYGGVHFVFDDKGKFVTVELVGD